ncbi:MAG: SIR2 family protein, partial [Pseudomarimonas sp.]
MNTAMLAPVDQLLHAVSMYRRNARFSILLGAGSSVDAGVPAAGQIVDEALRQLFARKYSLVTSPIHVDGMKSEKELREWAYAERLIVPEFEYSSCMESLFPFPELRQEWLTRYFEDAHPTSQHVTLAELARERTIDAVFTTNFDRLIESASPNTFAVVSHRSQSRDVPRNSPALYKLHGDFLFQSIRNTIQECTTLDVDEAQAIRRHASGNGFIVLGYGGGDLSVMSALQGLSPEDLPLGLWWLVRPGDEIPSSALRLHNTLLPNMRFVECAGFSQFINSLETCTRVNKSSSRRATLDQGLWVAHDGSLGKFLRSLFDWESSPLHPSMALVYGQTGIGKTRCAWRFLSEVSNRRNIVIIESNQGASARTPAELKDALSSKLKGADWQSRLGPSDIMVFVDDLHGHEEKELWKSLQDLSRFAKVLVTCRDTRRPQASTTPVTLVAFFEHPGMRVEELIELASMFRIPSLDSLSDEARQEELHKMATVAGNNVQKLLTAAMLHQDKQFGDRAPSSYAELVERAWDTEDELVAVTLSLFAGPTSTSQIAAASGVSLGRVNAHVEAYCQ